MKETERIEFKKSISELKPGVISIASMLNKNGRFKKDVVIASTKEYLQELLVFSDNEKEFVKEFANKNYRPELLFEDKEIVERISAHPMALWRVRGN